MPVTWQTTSRRTSKTLRLATLHPKGEPLRERTAFPQPMLLLRNDILIAPDDGRKFAVFLLRLDILAVQPMLPLDIKAIGSTSQWSLSIDGTDIRHLVEQRTDDGARRCGGKVSELLPDFVQPCQRQSLQPLLQQVPLGQSKFGNFSQTPAATPTTLGAQPLWILFANGLNPRINLRMKLEKFLFQSKHVNHLFMHGFNRQRGTLSNPKTAKRQHARCTLVLAQ